MKPLVLIIVLLLLCPSLVLAEKKDTFNISIEKINQETMDTVNNISSKVFSEVVNVKHGEALRVWAILFATGYDNLANEIMENINLFDGIDIDLFDKYSKEYQINLMDSSIYKLVVLDLVSFIGGYKVGMIEVLKTVFKINKDVANLYKEMAPQLYEDYLEEKKKKTE